MAGHERTLQYWMIGTGRYPQLARVFHDSPRKMWPFNAACAR